MRVKIHLDNLYKSMNLFIKKKKDRKFKRLKYKKKTSCYKFLCKMC